MLMIFLRRGGVKCYLKLDRFSLILYFSLGIIHCCFPSKKNVYGGRMESFLEKSKFLERALNMLILSMLKMLKNFKILLLFYFDPGDPTPQKNMKN